MANLAFASFYLKNRFGIQGKQLPKEAPMNLSTLYHRVLAFSQNLLIIVLLLLATFAMVHWFR